MFISCLWRPGQGRVCHGSDIRSRSVYVMVVSLRDGDVHVIAVAFGAGIFISWSWCLGRGCSCCGGGIPGHVHPCYDLCVWGRDVHVMTVAF